jgi:taurine dioxygenase
MTPSIETAFRPLALQKSLLDAAHDLPAKVGAKSYVPGISATADEESRAGNDGYEFEHLLPAFPDVQWPPLAEVPYHECGVHGDPAFRNLLGAATDVVDCAPKIGTEVSGVRLTRLTDAQKDDLARLIATRGVVFFRGQDDFDMQAQRELGAYFGTLHRHATTAVPRQSGLEDVHVVYTDVNSKDQRALFTPTFLWHSDVSN